MKKLIFIIAMALVALASKAQTSSPVHRTVDIINGQALWISNNITANYGNTNILFTSRFGNPYPFSASALGINASLPGFGGLGGYSLSTNTFIFGTTWYSGAYYTNTLVTNGANVPNWPLAWTDIPLSCDVNGNVPTDLSISVAGTTGDTVSTGSVSSNLATFTFVALPFGPTNYFANPNLAGQVGGVNYGNALGLKQITLTLAYTNGVESTTTTNLPSTFLQGMWGIRLASVVTANSTTNIVSRFDKISLTGFMP